MSHLESWMVCHIWKLYRSHLEAIQVTLDLSYFKTVYCVTFGSLSGLSRLEACLVCHIWKLFGGQVTFGSYIGHIWTLFALLHLPNLIPIIAWFLKWHLPIFTPCLKMSSYFDILQNYIIQLYLIPIIACSYNRMFLYLHISYINITVENMSDCQ